MRKILAVARWKDLHRFQAVSKHRGSAAFDNGSQIAKEGQTRHFGAVAAIVILPPRLEESPALVLATTAKEREAVLIIDQLDAISTASGRSTGFFDAIEGILTETRGLRERANIHVVVVCREFDWADDYRLKGLLAKEHDRVSVEVFPVERVREILAAETFDPALFAPRQLELLRLPQNLSLFLDAGVDPTKAPVFNTAVELFGRYWDAKRRAVRERVGGAADRWMDVISILVEEMTRTQQLSVPREKLDAIDPEHLDQMSSEGVLSLDGRRYGFGHESFFDYCFARSFHARQGTLLELLTSGEQHLFHRSQVRQVLTYLRDADRARYLRELASMLTDARVRAHLKDLAFALLGSVGDPSEDEWGVWEPLLRPMLAAIEAGNSKPARLRLIVEWNAHTTSRQLFDLVLRLIDNGVLDEARAPMAANSTFWLMFYELGKRRPEWVAEVVARWLRRRMAVVAAKGEDLKRGTLFGHDQFAEKPIVNAAANSPMECGRGSRGFAEPDG